ncbi:MAG: hypothetical protein ACJAUP_003249 [Cellvibrionaceae bacterium]
MDFLSVDMSHLRLFFGQEGNVLYRVAVFRALAPLLTFVVSFLVLIGLITIPSANTYAEKTVELYNASILVVNQNTEIRRKAVARGLKEVLVRLSGKASAFQSQEVQLASSNALDFLDRFSYQSTNQTLTIAGASQKATLLLMQFNSVSVKRLAKQAGLPIWSENRPDVLVWTASDSRGKRYVDVGSDIAEALNIAAANRGLPIALPVLDLEDRAALPVVRLWALDEDRVRLASKRYSTNAVLSGRFTNNGKSWGGSFVLMHKGKNRYLSAEGKDEIAVAASIIGQVSDYFSDIYAIDFTPTTSSSSTLPSSSSASVVSPSAALGSSLTTIPTRGSRDLFLQVNNVDDFSKYVALMNYLETLSLLSSVTIINASRPQLLLDVRLVVDKKHFLSTIELDNHLQRVAGGPSDSNVLSRYGRPLEFMWR